MEQRNEEDFVAITKDAFAVEKYMLSPSLRLSKYVAEKIVDSLTMIGDSLTEEDKCCDLLMMVKSLLHHWVGIFFSMEIDIQYLLLQKQQQQLQEASDRTVEDRSIADEITYQLLSTSEKSVGLCILQNAIEMSITLLHRKGGNYSLLSRQLAMLHSSNSSTFQGEKAAQKQPNKKVSGAAPTSSTFSSTSFSLFDLLDKNPLLYNNEYTCNSATLMDEILKSYNRHKLQSCDGKTVMETWLEENLKKLEKLHDMDPDFVNHPDWSTIEEILLLGLHRFASQNDAMDRHTDHYDDKKESASTNIAIRYLQVHTDIIQTLVHSGAIEEDSNTTIAVICGLLYNLLQTLNVIFFSGDNNSISFLLDHGQKRFTLSTPLEKLVGKIIITSHNVAKHVLLPYWSNYTISSLTQQRLEETTVLLFALYRVDTRYCSKWSVANNDACYSFQLLPLHLFASIDPHATLFDKWIRQLGPQTAWKLVMSTNLRNDLFKYISSAAPNYTTTIAKLTQFPSSGTISATYQYGNISSTSSATPNSSNEGISEGNSKRIISTLHDHKHEATIQTYASPSLSPTDSSGSENNISIIALESALFLWALNAARNLICTYRISIFMDISRNSLIADEVIAILTPYFTVLKVGDSIGKDHSDHNLVQLCGDVVETALTVFKPSGDIHSTDYATIYYYTAQELTAILLSSRVSNIFANPFSTMCLQVLHDMFENRLPVLVRRRSNLIDLRHAIVSQVVDICHTFFNVQWANMDCEFQKNGDNSLSTSLNVLDNSNKMEKFIRTISLLGSAINWCGILDSRHHSVITTSLLNFVKCASHLGLRREAYVTIATTLGRVQYSGCESIIERLDYVKECIDSALEELFLVMAVSNHHDIIMEKNRGASKLLHAIISICQRTKNGNNFLIQNSCFLRLLSNTLSYPNCEGYEQTINACSDIPVMLLALDGVWTYNVVECKEVFEILENCVRAASTSDGSCQVVQNELVCLGRFNFNMFFALLHRSLMPSTKDSDEKVKSDVFTSSTALFFAVLNEITMGTCDTMKRLDVLNTTKGISQKSTVSIYNISHADIFIRETENADTKASPKEVCLSFSSLMTAEFLTSIDLLPTTEADLFASKLNDKPCQRNFEGSIGLKEYYGTILCFLERLSKFSQIDLSAPDDLEEGMNLFSGISNIGQIFIDWLGIVVYFLCCGDIYKTRDVIQILQHKPGIQILWPRIRLEKGCKICLVSFLAEEILQIECPEVLIALEHSGCPLSIIICGWQRQCFVGILSFGEALLLQCISLLYGVDYLVYYAVCVIIHMKRSILMTAANKDLLTLSHLSASDFRVAASFSCATKLCCKYRELICSLYDEISQLA